jgi:hypothetical protein
MFLLQCQYGAISEEANGFLFFILQAGMHVVQLTTNLLMQATFVC